MGQTFRHAPQRMQWSASRCSAIGEELGAGIVEQDDVEFLRAVAFAGLARAAVHGVVAGKGLAGAGGGEHRQEEREVGELRHDFLDAHERDQRLRQRGGEARVALVFRDGDHAGLGDGEIRAGDAHVRGDIFVPQDAARDHRQFLGIVRGRAAEFLARRGR